jgi:excisionase family DNA binding protein
MYMSTYVDGRCKVKDMEERYYTLDEVAERLRVNRRTVDRWAKDQGLRTIRLGPPPRGAVRIAESDLEEFIERRRRATLSDTAAS